MQQSANSPAHIHHRLCGVHNIWPCFCRKKQERNIEGFVLVTIWASVWIYICHWTVFCVCLFVIGNILNTDSKVLAIHQDDDRISIGESIGSELKDRNKWVKVEDRSNECEHPVPINHQEIECATAVPNRTALKWFGGSFSFGFRQISVRNDNSINSGSNFLVQKDIPI